MRSIAEMNDAFISGQAAMIMNYFAFFPALANPGVNPFADKTGFFSGPAGSRWTGLCCVGRSGSVSVLSYTSPERQQASMDFIKWFAQEDIQKEWAKVGGYTCNKAVLASEEFLNEHSLQSGVLRIQCRWSKISGISRSSARCLSLSTASSTLTLLMVRAIQRHCSISSLQNSARSWLITESSNSI